MARTFGVPVGRYASTKQKPATADRLVRRRAGTLKAVRILSPLEGASPLSSKQAARAPSETEDSETEPEDDTFTSRIHSM